jgi:hypothetical protein
MKYKQPYGVADPNAPYVDRNTPGAVAGSRVPAAAIEHTMREIIAVITDAGLTPSEEDLTQLLQAIDLKIAAVTGEGDGALYVLMSALRARNPVYPEVVSADGTFNLAIPATGTVRIPAGIQVIQRGCFSDTTVQQDFATAANKVYHLRKTWGVGGGWALKDVADNTYNPSALAEADVAFDTSYDDMVTHKITTNGSNVATVFNLINKDRLWLDYQNLQTLGSAIEPGASSWSLVYRNVTIPINWSRKPKFKSLNAAVTASVSPSPGVLGGANVTWINSLTRYSMNFDALTDFGSGGIGSPQLHTKAAFGA